MTRRAAADLTRGVVLAACGVACAVGCRPRSAEGAGSPAPSASSAPSATPSAAPAESAVPAAPPPGDGCWGDPPAATAPSRTLLSTIAERCQLGSSTLLAEPVVKRVQAGAPVSLRLPAQSAATCLRALVVAEPTVLELRLALRDDQGRVRAESAHKGRFALLQQDGPVCVRAGEGTTLQIEALRGSGEVLLQVHRAE